MACALQGALQPKGIDHVELYVGNAYQATHFYRTMFGFRPPPPGLRDRLSIVPEQGEIRLVLTSGLAPDSPIAGHAALHGDGVKDVAFTVDDVEAAFATAVRRARTRWRSRGCTRTRTGGWCGPQSARPATPCIRWWTGAATAARSPPRG